MTNAATVRGYGWTPSRPDYRDLRLAFPAVDDSALPDTVDFRDPQPTPGRTFLPSDVYDQLRLGSCTANMAAAAFSYDLARQGVVFDYLPSRLFIYYCERDREGSVGFDSGASIADAAWALSHCGAPAETSWTYDITRFAERPPNGAYDEGAQYTAIRYARVDQTSSAIRQCLVAGVPVCIGFSVYTAFEGSEVSYSGVLNPPQPGESNVGGHAVLVVGYITGAKLAASLGAANRDTTKIDTRATYAIVRNSWGPDWGHGGYFYIHWDYLLDPNLASDFWTIQQVSTPTPAPIPVPTPGPPADPPVPAPTVDTFPFEAVGPWADSPHSWHKATVAAQAYNEWRNR